MEIRSVELYIARQCWPVKSVGLYIHLTQVHKVSYEMLTTSCTVYQQLMVSPPQDLNNALPAHREAAIDNAEAYGGRSLLQAGTTPQCKNKDIIAKGCYACNANTKTCSKCKKGYVMQFKNVNCLQRE